MDSNPDSDHLSHVDCDPDSNPDSGPGARVNAAIESGQTHYQILFVHNQHFFLKSGRDSGVCDAITRHQLWKNLAGV